jgi:hypothetical protein
MRTIVRWAIFSFASAFLAGCAPAGDQQPSPSAATHGPSRPESAVPSTLLVATKATPPWLATLGAQETSEAASYLFTSTPILTSTTDPRPLASSGPWIAYRTDEGLWVANPDGSRVKALFRFTSYPDYGVSLHAPPSGPFIAYADPAASSPFLQPYAGPIPALYLVTLPDLSARQLAPLASQSVFDTIIDNNPAEGVPEQSTAWFKIEQIRAAISRPGSLAWSPDGRTLAFSAALDGESSDLYMLDLASSRLTRLTSGPTQATDLQWSSDGRYIIHYAVSDINIGRSGPGLIVEGLWAADVTGAAPRLLTPGTAIPLTWIAPDQLIVYYWHIMCDTFDLEVIDIASGSRTRMLEGVFQAIAADPESATVLVGNSIEIPADEPTCPSGLAPGLYIVTSDGSAPRRVGDFATDYPTRSIRWSGDMQAFVVNDDTGTRYVTLSGEVSDQGTATTRPGLEALYRNPDYCDIVTTRDLSAVALSSDTTLYIALAPSFKPKAILGNLNGLCWDPPQWIYP